MPSSLHAAPCASSCHHPLHGWSVYGSRANDKELSPGPQATLIAIGPGTGSDGHRLELVDATIKRRGNVATSSISPVIVPLTGSSSFVLAVLASHTFQEVYTSARRRIGIWVWGEGHRGVWIEWERCQTRTLPLIAVVITHEKCATEIIIEIHASAFAMYPFESTS